MDRESKVMERVFRNARELNQCGFNVVVGGDYEGEPGMIEVKIRRRVETLPRLCVLRFFGFEG